MDEIESVLKIQCSPLTWPIGMGHYHLGSDTASIFEGRTRIEPGGGEIIQVIDSDEMSGRSRKLACRCQGSRRKRQQT